MDISRLLEEKGIDLKIITDTTLLKELRENTVITNESSFTKKLLSNLGFDRVYTISESSVEVAKEIEKRINTNYVVGFGGGKAIDIAKKVSFDLGLDLISVPTAPSHDGLISINCSLYTGNKRETIKAKYPKKVIIPLNLWKGSGNLKKSGICDLLSNLIALQDLSLAEKKGEKFSEFYKKLSFEAVEKVLNSQNERELAESLILSGLAMEETSRYCSGSEHEVERLLEKKINEGRYLHGQLAGTGTLISAKVYEIYSDNFKGLRFDSKRLFEDIKNKMRKKQVFDFAKEPLKDERFRPEILKEVSKVRPERFTLWNVVNSEKVDWGLVVDEILKE